MNLNIERRSEQTDQVIRMQDGVNWEREKDMLFVQ